MKKWQKNMLKLMCIMKLQKEKMEQSMTKKQAFLAGLKAGSPKWHDLRKNPEDLPSDVGWVSNQDGLPCYYEWATERWLNCRDIEIKVTAWCDMPSLGEDFSEEEE